MVDEIVRITGVDRNEILDDFREIHQKYHDTEHPFSALELRSLRSAFPFLNDESLRDLIDPALYEFNKARKQHLTLYPGVIDTLNRLRDEGISIVAHSEAKYYSVIDRIIRFELHEYFEAIYCRERSSPSIKKSDRWRASAETRASLEEKIFELEHHERKPAPGVIRDICHARGVTPAETAYVGDSISKDIVMARDAGVVANWARYRAEQSAEKYERLVRVSHWTKEDIAFEKSLKERVVGAKPDAILGCGFFEILNALGVE
jgi:phosphoglycolate phosphatase